MKRSIRRAAPGRLFVLSVVVLHAGCLLAGPSKGSPEEAALLEAHQTALQAFSAATKSVPADVPPLEVEGLLVCGTRRCGDGGLGNTIIIEEPERRLTTTAEFIDALEHGRDDFNLGYSRDEGYFDALPEIAYFVYPQPESVAEYGEGTNGHWRGRVAVWDVSKAEWIGAVSIALDGPDPDVIVTDIEIGGDGSQTLTYIDDPAGDRSRAQRTLDAAVRAAHSAAVERRENVTRAEQVLRQPPQALAIEMPKHGVVLVGKTGGTAKVLGPQGVEDPAFDEVTDVLAVDGGVLLERAINALHKGTPDKVFLGGQRVHDARFWAGWEASRSAKLDQDGAVAVAFDGVDRLARWERDHWSYLDTSSLSGDRIVDAAATGDGAVILASDGSAGSVLHRHNGKSWSPIGVGGRPYTVSMVGTTAYVGTEAGLWQVNGAADEAVKLMGQGTLEIRSFEGGVVAKTRRKPTARTVEFVHVAEGPAQRSGLTGSVLAKYAVARDGAIAVANEPSVTLLARGEPKQSFDVPGRVRSLDFDGKGRLWIGTESGAFCWSAGTLTEIPLAGVERLDHGIRLVRAIGDGVDP